MIFVVVGTQKFQFNRLLKTIDDLIAQGDVEEEVYAQIGNSDYNPLNYNYSRFMSKDEFEQRIEECDLLITHSGVATIISGIEKNKAVIVMPRLAKWGEHVDDHQFQIAKSFANMNYILYARDESQILELIKKSKTHKFDKYISQRKKMIRTIKDFIRGM